MTVDLNPGSGTFSGGTTLNVVGQRHREYPERHLYRRSHLQRRPGGRGRSDGRDQVTYGGTLTGSGSGTVQFSGGNIDPATGSGDGPANAGLTLNFSGSMFQWTGGGFFASKGNVTNLGTINLAGASDKGFFEDGTLYN